MGNARQLDRNILNIPREGVNISPTKNISFTSAPPNVSFLNILFPNIIIQYIKQNNKMPDNIENKNSFIPNKVSLITITKIEKNKVTSSGIIKYVTSLTITIIKNETIIRAIKSSFESPKQKKLKENNNPHANSIKG